MTTDFLETLDVELIEQAAQGKRLSEAYELGKSYYEQHCYHSARKVLGLVTMSGAHREAHELSLVVRETIQQDEEINKVLDAIIYQIRQKGEKP
ncbi:MAG: hypothetical protein A2X77_04365 [Gammaproteobacteria bacterium GWE2_42_36]|nr:MAG: hypothetical protein A2X77_04365 [Gammaproteobacteria bacterium GWE2_42_36]